MELIQNNTQVCMQQQNIISLIELKFIDYFANFIDNFCDKTNIVCYLFNLFCIGLFFIYAFIRMSFLFIINNAYEYLLKIFHFYL